ncbi:MAG: site-2 protease family protein [Paraclostridium sp.]|uniref:site-2 protease family protein n=1 Tax=Paraclostridium sp. TaxID=2023273 RepID=UPI003F30B43C
MGKKKNKNNKNYRIGDIFSTILMFAFGSMAGFISVENISVEDSVFSVFILLFIFIIAFTVQIILHEAGHLVGGLLSGYDFVSFRVGSLTLIKEDGKFAIKKFNIKGTGGQCLMMPKEEDYEKCHYILYNLGGVLMNFLVVVICFVIYLKFDKNKYINEALIAMMASGLVIVINNAIPMKISGIVNDGYNTMSIIKNKLNKYGLYMQLKVNGLNSRGIRIKDMPLNWFEIDSSSDFSNPLITGIKCIEANYYHDNLEFDKAKLCYEFLLSDDINICKLYENEIKCELIFYEIVGKRDESKINELYTKQLKTYVKASKCQINKLRLMYAYALIIEKDKKKVKKILEKIEVVKKKYPNKGELESELEIIEYVKNNFDSSNIMI